jgi:hypothetical protein
MMRSTDHPLLSEELIEAIAERAAEKAVTKLTHDLYAQIGRGIVNKIMTVIGVLAVALFFWAAGKGWIIPSSFKE